MKKWWLVILAILLLTACHDRKKQRSQDNTPVSAPTQKRKQDTLLVSTGGKEIVPMEQEFVFQELRRDTAEVTNLRLFTRKQRTIYSPQLMIGEWQQGSEHEQYMADGKGLRWDTDDDVSRDEAQSFTWTMDSNLLTLRFDLALGGLLFRQYVVTFVDDETLVYKDAYDGSFMFDKVPSGFTDRP